MTKSDVEIEATTCNVCDETSADGIADPALRAKGVTGTATAALDVDIATAKDFDTARVRTLAPMRSRNHMRAGAASIEAIEREEAAYWLGMAMHRRRPRRVLTALRVLLTHLYQDWRSFCGFGRFSGSGMPVTC